MLIIISDLHLWDGTLGIPVSDRTFSLFASRLRELAFQSSWQVDGRYKPIETLDILLLGDVLDPLQSERWHETQVRPWHDQTSPEFARKLQEISRAIIAQNHNAVEVFNALVRGDGIHLPPADQRGKPDFFSRSLMSPRVRIHYMVGNHDWYYRIPGQAFDDIRKEVISALALSNTSEPFAHDAGESAILPDLFAEYGLSARHGDIFDNWSYDREHGRTAASLSDIFSVEVTFRFPGEIRRRFGNEVPPILMERLAGMTSIHPTLAIPIWTGAQIREHASPALAQEIKKVWDELAVSFLDLSAVRERGKRAGRGTLNTLRLFIKLYKHTTLETATDILSWIYKNDIGHERSILRHARKEASTTAKNARFITYGHTHTQEIVALDKQKVDPAEARQVYVNTGTWSTVYEFRRVNNARQAIPPTNLMTCLSIYKDGERRGRPYETWWANFT